jgi:hypothetical protein
MTETTINIPSNSARMRPTSLVHCCGSRYAIENCVQTLRSGRCRAPFHDALMGVAGAGSVETSSASPSVTFAVCRAAPPASP